MGNNASATRAGGLGLAAIQICKAAGALPLGTAGSTQKRGYLRELGVATAVNSRSTEFSEAFAAGVGSGRPQVVLNSLTSPGKSGALDLAR